MCKCASVIVCVCVCVCIFLCVRACVCVCAWVSTAGKGKPINESVLACDETETDEQNGGGSSVGGQILIFRDPSFTLSVSVSETHFIFNFPRRVIHI